MAWHDIWSKHMIWYSGGSGGFFLVWNTLASRLASSPSHPAIADPRNQRNEYNLVASPFLGADHPEDIMRRGNKFEDFADCKNFVVTLNGYTAMVTRKLLHRKHPEMHQNRVAQNTGTALGALSHVDLTVGHYMYWSRILLCADCMNPIEIEYQKFFLDVDEDYIRENYTRHFNMKNFQEEMFIKHVRAYTERNQKLYPDAYVVPDDQPLPKRI